MHQKMVLTPSPRFISENVSYFSSPASGHPALDYFTSTCLPAKERNNRKIDAIVTISRMPLKINNIFISDHTLFKGVYQ